ncbi:MAG: DUF2231 domain-containing protein, partial [Nakamurella sp.]
MTSINGLPAHILLVHAVVIFIPLTALLVVLAAAWPAAHRRMGVVLPIVALVALILVPVATDAGEWLEARLPGAESNPLIRAHTQLGDQLLPWAIGMFVGALALWLLPTLARRGVQAEVLGAVWIRVVVGVLAVAVSVVAVVQVVRIGDSGSKAVWSGTVCVDPPAQ